MSRERQWRRAQADRKLNKILSLRKIGTVWWYEAWCDIKQSENKITYTRRISVDETIEILVVTYQDFLDRERLRARKLRDNPKICSCQICCNPRSSGIYRGDRSFTLQERKWIFNSNEQIKEAFGLS